MSAAPCSEKEEIERVAYSEDEEVSLCVSHPDLEQALQNECRLASPGGRSLFRAGERARFAISSAPIDRRHHTGRGTRVVHTENSVLWKSGLFADDASPISSSN